MGMPLRGAGRHSHTCLVGGYYLWNLEDNVFVDEFFNFKHPAGSNLYQWEWISLYFIQRFAGIFNNLICFFHQ
jgi:hypothetical protein